MQSFEGRFSRWSKFVAPFDSTQHTVFYFLEDLEVDKKVVIGVAVGAAIIIILMIGAVVISCQRKIRYQNDLKRLNAIQR